VGRNSNCRGADRGSSKEASFLASLLARVARQAAAIVFTAPSMAPHRRPLATCEVPVLPRERYRPRAHDGEMQTL